MMPSEVKAPALKKQVLLADDRRSIIRQVMALAVPAIGQSFLETLVFLVDRVMIGRYDGDSLASMQISGTLIWALVSFLSAFGVGGAALVGRAIGGGDRTLVGATVRGSLLFALLAGTIVAWLSLFSLEDILELFAPAGAGVQGASHDYLEILLPAIPLMVLGSVAAALWRAAGNTRTPFLIALAANSVNAVINYCLIFGNYGLPALGVKGAAIGSVVALSINAIVLLVMLGSRKRVLTWRGFGGEKMAIARVLKISWPSFGEQLVQHTGELAYLGMIGALGGIAMAANQALISIELICFMSAEGFGIAAATIVSQNLGRSRPDWANLGLRVATFLAIAWLGIFSFLFLLIPDQLMSSFSPDIRIVTVGIPCLYIAAIAQPFMAISLVLGQAFRIAGDTRTVFYITLIGWLIVRLGTTYIFTFVFNLGLMGIWLGSTCDWMIRAAVLVIIFFWGRWSKVLGSI